MKKILIFQHESWIGAPHLISLLSNLAIPYSIIKIESGDTIPNTVEKNIAALIFLGGTMSVNDNSLAWIKEEINLIKVAHKQKIPILGHCLGSQLISKALGGEITTMKQKEIGWHPIKFINNNIATDWKNSLADGIEILLWHHDEFSIPEGATSLYTTSNCKNQAFVKDNILATVAHIEVSVAMLHNWLDVYGHDIEANKDSVQSIAIIKTNIESKIQKMHKLSTSFYLKWLKQIYPEQINT